MIDVVKVPGTGTNEKRNGWFLDWYNQWPAIFNPGSHNWQDWSLTLFKIAGENSPYKRSWELEIGLLGVTLIVTYVFRDIPHDPCDDGRHIWTSRGECVMCEVKRDSNSSGSRDG